MFLPLVGRRCWTNRPVVALAKVVWADCQSVCAVGNLFSQVTVLVAAFITRRFRLQRSITVHSH
jgi:hypothetical protein